MKTILLADDDADDAFIFQETLHRIDAPTNFQWVDSGEAVFEHLENKDNQRPDIIFLDLNMPRMNGWQCLAKLKNTKHLEDIPVMMYTTSNNPRDFEIAQELRALGLITKPSDPKILRKVLTLLIMNLNSNELSKAVKDAYLITRD